MSDSSTEPPDPSSLLGRVRAFVVVSGDRRLWWVSFALFAAVGAIWALSTPLLSGPDEPAHAGKAAAVAGGELTWVDRYEVVGTSPADPSRVETWVVLPKAYAELDYACIALPPLRPASCMTPIPRVTDEVAAINSAGAYPPVPYLLIGWPSKVLAPSKALYAMRLVHATLCAGFLASALVAARRSEISGFVLVGLAAALTPMVFFLMGVINPNGLEIATAVAACCAGLEVFAARGPVPTRSLARLFVASGSLVLVRPLSIAMLGAIAAVVLLATARRNRVMALVRDRRVHVGLVGFAGCAALAIAWLLYAKPQDVLWGTPRPGITLAEAVEHSFGQIPWRVRQMIGVFGWVDSPAYLPNWAIVWWLVVVGALVVGALWVGSWRERLAVAASVGGLVVLTISEATQAEEIGFVWQGRYSLAVAIVVPIVASFVVGRSGRLPDTPRVTLATLAVVTLAFVHLLGYLVTMRRYVIGDPSPILDYLTEGAWSPKVSKQGLALAATATIAALAGWFLVVLRYARPDPAAQDERTSSASSVSSGTS